MKSIRHYSHIVFATIILIAGSALFAQEKESEIKRQKEIQVEEMSRQKAMQEEEMRIRKEMLEEQREKMKQMEQQHADQMRDMEFRARESSRAGWYLPSTGVYPDGEHLIGTYGYGNHSQLILRKSFRGTTNNSKGEFEVDKDIRQFRCQISGSVKSGEIFIGIEYPDGKTFKELVINPSADINYSQAISIKEGEETKYSGSWSYVIKTDEAEGSYVLQIMTH